MRKFLFLMFWTGTLLASGRALAVAPFPYNKITYDAYGYNGSEKVPLWGNNPGNIIHLPPSAQGCTRVYKGDAYYHENGYHGTLTCTPPNRRHFWTTDRCKKFKLKSGVIWALNADCSETSTDGLYELKCKSGTVWNSTKEVCDKTTFKVSKKDLSGSTSEEKTSSKGSIEYNKTLPASHYCTVSAGGSIGCKALEQQFFSKARCEKYITDSIMTSKHAYCSKEDKDGVSTLICKDGYPWETRFTIAKNVCGNSFKITEQDLWGEDYNNGPVYLGKRYTPTNSEYEIDKVAAEISGGRPEKKDIGEVCFRAGEGNVYIRCSLQHHPDRFYTKTRCEQYARNNNVELDCADKGSYAKGTCKAGYVQYSTMETLKCLAKPEHCQKAIVAPCPCNSSRACTQVCQSYVPDSTICTACESGYALRNGKCFKNTVTGCAEGLVKDSSDGVYCKRKCSEGTELDPSTKTCK